MPGILVVHFWLEDVMLLGFYGTGYLPGPLPRYSRTPGTHLVVLRVTMAISGNVLGCMCGARKRSGARYLILPYLPNTEVIYVKHFLFNEDL